MRGRRTPYEIYWEILVFCRTPRLFTAIVNRCDLNSRLGQEYLRVPDRERLPRGRPGRRKDALPGDRPGAGVSHPLFHAIQDAL